jgi:hypothetical protein
MDLEFSIRDQLASVLKGFKERDYDSIFRSLERTKDQLMSLCGTANEREFVSLAFFVTAITLADVKRIPLEATEEFVKAAFAHIAADPSLLTTSIAGYAGRCRAEGRPELGRLHLRKAVEYMDAGNHWTRLAPQAEPAIRGQLAAMEK